MSDINAKNLIVNKDIFMRQPSSNKMVKLNVGYNDDGATALFFDGSPLGYQHNKQKKKKGPMYPTFGRAILEKGKCTIASFDITENTCIQLTPCSKLDYGVISGDLTISSICPGLSFSVEAIDPVEQTIVETDSREFFWYIM